MLEHAENFAAAGWSVLPLHGVTGGVCQCSKGKACKSAGKHPATSSGVKDATQDRERLAAFKWSAQSNLGIATGAASGLVVVDVDARHGGLESLSELQAKFGPLPVTITVETGGGGLHLYFRHWQVKVKNRAGLSPGIDVRGDAGYVVAPPSLHKSGQRYRWRQGCEPSECALADLPDAWRKFVTGPRPNGRALQRDREYRETEIPKQSLGRWVDLKLLDSETKEAINRAIGKSLPEKEGERNFCVFLLCKALQGIPALAGADPFGLSPILEAWHKRARTSGEHSLEDCRDEFLYAWPRVRFPGETNLRAIVAQARTKPIHAGCLALGINESAHQALVALCAELQLHHGDAPFFLSCHLAAVLVPLITGRPISHTTCNKMLNGLCARKVLALVEKETKNRARRYRFIWSAESSGPAPAPAWLTENSI